MKTRVKFFTGATIKEVELQVNDFIRKIETELHCSIKDIKFDTGIAVVIYEALVDLG